MSEPVVRVGVAAIIKSSDHPGCVLMGKRKGSHGAGLLAFPGGHLEMNETWATCAVREIKEETDLDIENLTFTHATNDMSISGNPNKHYVTIFMSADVASESSSLKLMEPNKCEGWEWMPWGDVLKVYNENRSLLFDPIVHYIEDGKTPFPHYLF